MKLLQNCWSEILILDLVHRLVRETWSGEVTLVCPFNYDHLNTQSLIKLDHSSMLIYLP